MKPKRKPQKHRLLKHMNQQERRKYALMYLDIKKDIEFGRLVEDFEVNRYIGYDREGHRIN